MNARLLGWAGLLAALAFLGCAKPAPKPSEPPPVPVTATAAVVKTVPVQTRVIGKVKAIATVSVRPQVTGRLTEVHFKEGAYVTKGQKLFTIDPRQYEAAVKQAEANLAKSTALWEGAKKALEETEALKGASSQELNVVRTAAASAEATVKADRGALEFARIQEGYTAITSPLDGRTGGLLVHAGNLVGPADVSPLVVINQISPIHVAFAVPEHQLPDVLAALEAGPVPVAADLRGGGPLATGALAFIDNTADEGTGTIAMKAEFANADRKLWPGLFVDVVLRLGERPASVVVPSAAVQTGQQGQYVYVVTADKKAELRAVTVAFEAEGESVIAAGLAGGETVVTEGQLRLTTGTKVDLKAPPKAAR
jgi:multidrug efflux system membrane fusion protein